MRNTKKVLKNLIAVMAFAVVALLPTNVDADSLHYSKETAQTMSVNREYSLTPEIKNDEYWYSFTLSKPTLVNLRFYFHNVDWDGETCLYLYDDTDHCYYDFSTSWKDDDVMYNSGNLLLRGGKYYVRLYNGKGREIKFKVNTATIADSFAEKYAKNNDEISYATSISTNKKYKATLALNESADYYKFNTSVKGKLKLEIKTFDGTKMNVTVYDKMENTVESMYVGSNQSKTLEIELAKGRYYVCCQNDGVGAYTINARYIAYKSPAKVSSVAVKSKAKKKMTVSWKKRSGVSAYQIQYSTNSKFKSAKTVKVSAGSKTKTISGLKSKKKYYVRVRAYNNYGTIKKYGSWSTVKKVTIK